MIADSGHPPSGWTMAILAASVFAADPAGTGIVLQAGAGPQRERWLAMLRRLLPDMPLRKLPPAITDDRLLGGLDLSATLAAGRPVAERGVLAAAHGGVVLIPGAERLPGSTAARIAAVHDTGETRIARDGATARLPARFGLLLLNEAAERDEAPPATLLERIAIAIDLSTASLSETAGQPHANAAHIAAARRQIASVHADGEAIHALCAAAGALGIGSARAPLLALRVARIAAALDGEMRVGEPHLDLAARLVLAWRATTLMPADPGAPPPDLPSTDSPSEPSPENRAASSRLDDVVLAAARAALPPDLLARMAAGTAAGQTASRSGRAGAVRKAAMRGRCIGNRRGRPSGSARLDIVATLQAAAPWQRLRPQPPAGRLAFRPGDFRIRRFAERSETLTIFAVDASGSQALHRLAEAKGAIELLLADCYVRRDHVAMIGFRGTRADLLLPPTRSLARAKRCLATLPGGGGTPLAPGIDAAAGLAHAAGRRARTPLIVILTDGRANIARDGTPDRIAAHAHAEASARSVRREGWTSLLIDTGPQPDARASQIAAAMGAAYLPLPHLDAGRMTAAVKAVRESARPPAHG